MYLPTIFFLIDRNCRRNGRGLVESWCWRWGDSNITAGARLSQRVRGTDPGTERWRKTERVHDRREKRTIGFRIQKRRNRRSRCPEHADESLSHSEQGRVMDATATVPRCGRRGRAWWTVLGRLKCSANHNQHVTSGACLASLFTRDCWVGKFLILVVTNFLGINRCQEWTCISQRYSIAPNLSRIWSHT